MGRPMALNLVKAGHRVRVWNRSAQAAEVEQAALDDDGAQRGVVGQHRHRRVAPERLGRRRHLGLGRMGRPMALNLVKAGHRVRVWNRSAQAAEDLDQVERHRPAHPAEPEKSDIHRDPSPASSRGR
jgi:3-hydroxyisobutyrate dehydrogenase-like beta-hydroxyacid dehydrogenase